MAAKTAAGERAAAFRDLYNTMFRTRAAERGENPAVIFDTPPSRPAAIACW